MFEIFETLEMTETDYNSPNSDAQNQDATSSESGATAGPSLHETELEREVHALLQPAGFELIDLEAIRGRTARLTLFVDRPNGGLTVDDCATVSKLIDPALDSNSHVLSLFGGPYELEVSSPGVERRLRRPKDFVRFAGDTVRVSLFRPLTADEAQNGDYIAKNPKQKHYIGTLVGLSGDTALSLDVDLTGAGNAAANGRRDRKGKKSKNSNAATSVARPRVHIPLALVAKANLEPDWNAAWQNAESATDAIEIESEPPTRAATQTDSETEVKTEVKTDEKKGKPV